MGGKLGDSQNLWRAPVGTIYSHQMNYYKKGLVSDVRHKHISKILIPVQIQGGFPPISSIFHQIWWGHPVLLLYYQCGNLLLKSFRIKI